MYEVLLDTLHVIRRPTSLLGQSSGTYSKQPHTTTGDNNRTYITTKIHKVFDYYMVHYIRFDTTDVDSSLILILILLTKSTCNFLESNLKIC